ncbi:MAG: TonB-dependent receptor, partial [Chlorobiales bacterium]|nr:TonB-dependent receptor [Chlorobiales bacterium]
MKKQTLFFMTICLIVSASLALSQTSLGEIGGFVLDKDGKAVIGATIKATSESLMGVRNVVSGAKGYYRIINLPPGKYTLAISMESYESQEVQGISVRAGKTSTLNVTLEVGDFEEILVIEHEAPLIDTSSPERSINIDGDFINRLPLAYDREWDNVWALSPGTVNEGQFGPYGNRVTVQGADIFQNVWNLDGMQIGDTFTNANGVYFSPDIIDDVQLVTTGFNAGVASGQGGYVNVVTKSGGNDFHGTVSFTYQPESWNWTNIEDGEAAKTELYMPEFSLGGPIMKDKAWFFGNFRRNIRNEAYARTAADFAVFDKLELPYPTQQRETTGNNIFGKITYALTDSMKIVGTYNYDIGEETNADMGGLYADNSGVDIERGGQYANLSLEGFLGENLDWSIKGAYYKANNLLFGPGGLDTPSYTRFEGFRFSGGLIAGDGDSIYHSNRRGLAWGSDTEDERWEFKGDARYYLEDFYGNHSISVGFSGIPKQVAYSDRVYATPARIYETKNAQG